MDKVSKVFIYFMFRFLLVSITFFTGLTVEDYWRLYFPYEISLSELNHNPEKYTGKTVRVHSVIHTYISAGWVVFYLFEENGNSEFSDAGITLKNMVEPTTELKLKLDELRNISGLQSKKANVVLIGKFRGNATKGCYGPRDYISVLKIEAISSISEKH